MKALANVLGATIACRKRGLLFLVGSQGLDGLVMARIIAMIGLAGFYVGGLLLHLRTIRLGAKHA